MNITKRIPAIVRAVTCLIILFGVFGVIPPTAQGPAVAVVVAVAAIWEGDPSTQLVGDEPEEKKS